MKKKNYVSPELKCEAFVPSEYVAACWGVSCNVEVSNNYEQTHYAPDNISWYEKYVNHGSAHCGTASNQVIYDDNGDNVPDRMVEEGTDGLGNLTCTIYTDANFTTTKHVSEVRPGESIYWTTQSGEKVWHHHGVVYETFPGRPLHS